MKIGLALGAGGARGFAHLGVARALRELKIPISYIAGTSMGAIVGSVIAADMLQRVLNWTEEPDWFKLPSLFTKWHLPRCSLLGSKKIESFFSDMICAKTFEDLSIPFAAVATDLTTGEMVVLKSGDLYSAIQASMAIPGVFDPVRREGRILVDGGLVRSLPVDVCQSMGADKVIAVDVNIQFNDRRVLDDGSLNFISIIDRAFTIVCNKNAEEAWTMGAADVFLSPPVGDLMMMDLRGAAKIVEIGYRYTMNYADKLLSMTDCK